MKLTAQQKVFLASAAAHGLLFVLLSPWLTLVAGAEPPKAAEIRSDIEVQRVLPPKPPTMATMLPPPPEELPPAELVETLPPEEALAEAPLFEPPVEPSSSTAFAIPRERSIAIRAAPVPMREPAPVVASAPPPVRSVPVSMPVRRPMGASRKALPIKGNSPPRYPPRAVERALEGVVLVEAWLDRDGKVLRVEVLRGSGYVILDREALRAVGIWRFRPALKDGVAVPSRIEVPIRFRIG